MAEVFNFNEGVKIIKGIPHVSRFTIKILGKKEKFLTSYMTEIYVRRMGGNQAIF